MGGSGWWCATAYRPELADALAGARQEVFEAGTYVHGWDLLPVLRGMLAEDLAGLVELGVDGAGGAIPGVPEDSIEHLAAGGQPRSIEEALFWAQEDGTHSLIDIQAVAAEPQLFALAPLGDAEVAALCGSATPSPADVEARIDDLMERIEQRWTALAITAYVDGAPTQIYFVGASGD